MTDSLRTGGQGGVSSVTVWMGEEEECMCGGGGEKMGGGGRGAVGGWMGERGDTR